MKFKRKLMAAFSIAVILPVILTFCLSIYYFKRNLYYDIDIKLKECVDGINAEFHKLNEDILKRIDAINVADFLDEYYRTGNRTKLLEILREYKNIGGYDILELGDSQGTVIGRGHNPEHYGENKKQYNIINSALLGKTSVDFETGKQGIAIRAVKPVKKNNRIIGTLMTGYYLDKNMAQNYKNITAHDIGFYFENGAQHSTLPFQFTAAPRLIEELKQNPYKIIESGQFSNYRFMLKAIYQQTGRYIGFVLAAKNLNDVYPYYVHSIKILAYNVVFGLIISIFAVGLISKNFSIPLETLQKNMNLIGRGFFNARIPYPGSDEFGILENHFNSMAQELENLSYKLQSAQNELMHKEKLAVAGRLMAEIAHEIRNPLNSMAANLELLKTDIRNSNLTKSGDRILILNNEISRLNRIITAFLDSSVPVSLNLQNSDLLKTLRATLKLIESNLQLKKIRQIYKSNAESIIITHDVDLMQNVFVNILKNALESIDGENGEITVDVKNFDTEVEIIISDNGCGMTAEAQKRIFEPYYTTKPGGCGMGLGFALKIVEAHNGKLMIESRKNYGTECRIIIPKRNL